MTWLARLREAIAPFTAERVLEHIGMSAHQALARNETTPAERATRDGSALSTMVRLFSLQRAVSVRDAQRAFAHLDELAHHGVVRICGDEVRAAVDLRPYGDESHDRWIFCDLTPALDGQPHEIDSDHVLGISEASSTLAQLTIRQPVSRALDMGTGCGVQSLHLADHVQRIVATDVNPRALKFARWTAELNGMDWDVRDGSLYEPVADERFDLIVTNPPFVVSPPGSTQLTYRDSGLPGDDVVRKVVAGARDHLTEGGVAHVLANWIHYREVPWQERLAEWTKGIDVWAVEREVADPESYAEMWLADAGLRGTPHYRELYDQWLQWFDEQGIVGIGFGWLTIRNQGSHRAHQRFEQWMGPIEQPLGPTHHDWLAAVERFRGLTPQQCADLALRRATDIAERAIGVPGAEYPARIVMHQEHGLRRSREVDTVLAGLLGAADGELTIGQILDALAGLLDEPAADLRARYLPQIPELIDAGFLSS